MAAAAAAPGPPEFPKGPAALALLQRACGSFQGRHVPLRGACLPLQDLTRAAPGCSARVQLPVAGQSAQAWPGVARCIAHAWHVRPGSVVRAWPALSACWMWRIRWDAQAPPPPWPRTQGRRHQVGRHERRMAPQQRRSWRELRAAVRKPKPDGCLAGRRARLTQLPGSPWCQQALQLQPHAATACTWAHCGSPDLQHTRPTQLPRSSSPAADGSGQLRPNETDSGLRSRPPCCCYPCVLLPWCRCLPMAGRPHCCHSLHLARQYSLQGCRPAYQEQKRGLPGSNCDFSGAAGAPSAAADPFVAAAAADTPGCQTVHVGF